MYKDDKYPGVYAVLMLKMEEWFRNACSMYGRAVR